MNQKKHWWFLPLFVIGILLAILLMCAIASPVLEAKFSTFITSAVLIVTFFAILLYTRYSADLALMNENIAKVQERDFRDRQTPKVSVNFLPSKDDQMHISVVLHNLNAHKVGITLDLNLNYRGRKIAINDNFYNGVNTWYLNPLGFFRGHHRLADDLKGAGIDFDGIRKKEKEDWISGETETKQFSQILYFAPKVKLTSEFKISDTLWERVYYYDFEKDRIYPYPGLS